MQKPDALDDLIALTLGTPVKIMETALFGFAIYLLYRGLRYKKYGSLGLGVIMLIGFKIAFPNP